MKIIISIITIFMMMTTASCAQTQDTQQLSVHNTTIAKPFVSNPAFVDVPTNVGYTEAVNYCKDNNIMSGIPETEFAPNAKLSRAMFATILWRIDGSKNIDGEIPFNDIEKDSWYTEAIKWAVESDIVNGFSPSIFGADSYVTREQALTLLYKYEQYKKGELHVTGNLTYKDTALISDWAYTPVLWAFENDLLSENPVGTLGPKNEISRAETAIMFYNYMTLNGNTKGEISKSNYIDNDENKFIRDENGMISVNIIINDNIFAAKFYDNETSRALFDMMPLTLEMPDLNNNEIYYSFSNNLPYSSTEQPSKMQRGEIMLWSENTLVVFYENFSNSYGGYVRLGCIDDVDGLKTALVTNNIVAFSLE